MASPGPQSDPIGFPAADLITRTVTGHRSIIDDYCSFGKGPSDFSASEEISVTATTTAAATATAKHCYMLATASADATTGACT